ncbi:type II toxin-antitoxin system HigB family toxin [Orbaceae bacterium ac157xtp]
MKLISVAQLKHFWTLYPDSEQQLKAWVDEIKKAQWQSPNDIKALYKSASILKNRRVVFNICGNKYRLIVAIAYQQQIIFVKFIGTHKQYDNVDANTISIGG